MSAAAATASASVSRADSKARADPKKDDTKDAGAIKGYERVFLSRVFCRSLTAALFLGSAWTTMRRPVSL